QGLMAVRALAFGFVLIGAVEDRRDQAQEQDDRADQKPDPEGASLGLADDRRGEPKAEGDEQILVAHGLIMPSRRLAEGLRVADRADLGNIAAKRQARRPVEHGAYLAGRTGDLAHVVGAGEPPGRETAEGAAADPADRLVAAEVDEGGLAAVLEPAWRT